MSKANPRCEIHTATCSYFRAPGRGKRARWERIRSAPSGRSVYEGLANEHQSLWLELATIEALPGIDRRSVDSG